MKPPVYSLMDFKVRPDSVNAARIHMRKVEKSVRSTVGCLQYHFLQDLDDPTIFAGYGIFASNADLQQHFADLRGARERDPTLNEMLDPKRPFSLRMLDRL